MAVRLASSADSSHVVSLFPYLVSGMGWRLSLINLAHPILIIFCNFHPLHFAVDKNFTFKIIITSSSSISIQVNLHTNLPKSCACFTFYKHEFTRGTQRFFDSWSQQWVAGLSRHWQLEQLMIPGQRSVIPARDLHPSDLYRQARGRQTTSRYWKIIVEPAPCTYVTVKTRLTYTVISKKLCAHTGERIDKRA